MGLFARFGIYARGIVYLRSIAKSLRVLADNDSERLHHEFGPRRKPKQRVEIATLDLAEAERRWERQLAGNNEDE